MKPSALSSTALLLSGVAGVVMPDRIGAALQVKPTTKRGSAEVRAGLGGTYAALGAWALVTRNPAVLRAVGVTWLGAAAARVWALRVDKPETSWTYWAYLAAEVGLGGAAVVSPSL
jgi:hypothetical protein